MALLYFDGFDLGDMALRYGTTTTTTSSSTRFSSGLAARGVQAMQFAITATQEVYTGFAFNATATLDTSLRPHVIFYGDAGATSHIVVGVKNTAVEARLGSIGGGILASGVGSFSVGSWYHIEVYVKIADSGGRVVVKVDGTTLIDFTGDTKAGGTAASVDRVRLQSNGVSVDWDDWYICDTSGSAPTNTYLGDVKVVTLAPTGAGTSTDMAPSAGSNWQCVDERPYSATDYVSGTAGEKDTYVMSDLPSGVTAVYGVQTVAIAKKTDAGTLSLNTVVRSDGTDYDDAAVSLGTVDDTTVTLHTVDPATSAAWTASAVNALEVGIKAS